MTESKWTFTSVINWLFKKMLWAIIFVLFGFLTARTGSKIFIEFVSGKTTSNVEISFNQTMTFPNATLCIPLYAEWLFADEIDNDFTNQYFEESITDLFETQSFSRENLFNSTMRWPSIFVFFVYHYLTYITQFEFFIEGIPRSQTIMNADLTSSLFSLEKKLLSINITTNELRQRFGMEIANIFGVNVQYNSALLSRSAPVDMNETTYIGVEQICYRMGLEKHFFHREVTAETIEIVITPPSQVASNANLFKHKILIDLSGRLVVHVDDIDGKVVASAYFDQHLYLPISIDAVYRALPKNNGTISCSETQSEDECIAKCRQTFIRDICNCTSTTISNLNEFSKTTTLEIYSKFKSRIGECSLEQYFDCLTTNENYDHSCENNCPSSCETISFSFDIIDHGYMYKDYGSIIELTMATFDYPVIEEKYAWTLESFLGAFGGAIALWLGLNFVQTLKFAAKILTSWYFWSRIKSVETGNAACSENSSERKLEQTESQTTIKRSFKQKIYELTEKISQIPKPVLIQLSMKATMFTIFGVMTAILTLRFCQEYLSEPTQSSFDIMFNQSIGITLPNAVVCLPLFPGELDKTPRNCSFDPVSSAAHYANILEYFNQSHLTKKYFLNKSRKWPNSVLHVAHTYLALLSYCETYDDSQILNCSAEDLSPIWTQDGNIMHNCTNSGGSDLLNLARTVLEINLRMLNISTAELRQSFGKVVAKLYSFTSIYTSTAKFFTSSEAGLSKKIEIIETLFVGARQICYELGLSEFSLTQDSYMTFQSSESTLPWSVRWDENYGSEGFWMTIDFRKRYWLNSDYFGQVARIIFQQYCPVSVSLQSVYRLLPYRLGQTRCSNTLSFDECTANCRVKYIKKLCNCSATTWPELDTTADSSACSLANYNTCLNINGTGDIGCKSECIDLCERSTFKFFASTVYWNNDSEATLSIENFEYPVFEENFQWTFESFAGAFGGIIGLFLGLDFFGIINSIYEFVIIFIRKLQKAKKNHNKTTDSVLITVETNSPQYHSTNERKMQSVWKYCKWLCREAMRKLAKNLFKIVTITALTYLIFKSAVNFVQDYTRNKTVPDMTFVMQGNISLPKSTICISLMVGELYRPPKSSDSSYANLSLNYSINAYFGNSTITKETFLDINQIWPNFLIHATHAYLSFLTDVEASPEYNLATGIPYYIGLDHDLLAAVLTLENNLGMLKITIDELREKFGLDVNLLFFSVHATQITGNSSIAEIEISATTSVSGVSLCYELPFDRFPFNNRLRQIIRITSANDNMTIPNRKQDYRSLEVDFTGGNRTGIEPDTYQHSQSTQILGFGGYVFEGISVDTVFRSLPTIINGRPICSRLVTLENCRATCRVNLIQDLCNCSATSWSYLASNNLNECKIKDYYNCLKYNVTENIECMSSCVELCEIRNYRIVSNFEGYAEEGQIELQFVNFDYPIFEEQLLWTFDSFTGELGNVLGFYVGLDFLTIMEFLLAKAILLIAIVRPRQRNVQIMLPFEI